MNEPRVYADIHNKDRFGKIRLNTVGTIIDLNKQNVVLQTGKVLNLYFENVEAKGVVTYSESEECWTAILINEFC